MATLYQRFNEIIGKRRLGGSLDEPKAIWPTRIGAASAALMAMNEGRVFEFLPSWPSNYGPIIIIGLLGTALIALSEKSNRSHPVDAIYTLATNKMYILDILTTGTVFLGITAVASLFTSGPYYDMMIPLENTLAAVFIAALVGKYKSELSKAKLNVIG